METELVNVFKPKILISIFLVTHVVIYLIWVFITLQPMDPIEAALYTPQGRGCYVMACLCLGCASVPFWMPFETKPKAQ